MSDQLVAFTNDPNQSGELALQIDGTQKSYLYVLRFNEVADYWVLSLYNLQNVLILDSIPFVTGNGISNNVLRQFVYLSLGYAGVLNQSNVSTPDYPNVSDLVTDFTVVWQDTP
jgi:hypothetical protein